MQLTSHSLATPIIYFLYCCYAFVSPWALNDFPNFYLASVFRLMCNWYLVECTTFFSNVKLPWLCSLCLKTTVIESTHIIENRSEQAHKKILINPFGVWESCAKRYNLPLLDKSLQLHNSPVDCARELFKPSKDLKSLLVVSGILWATS